MMWLAIFPWKRRKSSAKSRPARNSKRSRCLGIMHVLMRFGPFLYDSPVHCLRIGIGETFPADKLSVDLAGVPAVKPGSK